jgi:tetratricopeptide (TPR) repeat protein
VLAAREGGIAGAFAAAATRTLPRDIASFTGRQAELGNLLGTLAAAAAGSGGLVGIHAIGGMAGIGKTAFAVHAAHRLAGSFPDGQYFLPLHGHTPGQRPVEPADALASLLATAGLAAQHLPPSVEALAARWRDFVADKKILLLLDDASGHEQVRPLLPGTASSLVLVTSRRRLTALEDAAVISLGALTPGEAATLLARLAARPDIRATDAAVGEITRLCGYLPLAIGMLARQLSHHPAWTAAGMAASLTAARNRLALIHAENLSVAAAFDLSYADLTPDQQRLFRRLGLAPGPSIDEYAAAALDDTSLDTARRHLDELYDQHLLAEPAPGRYVLHDLLREHARALAAADNPAESEAVTTRLLDYYLHTALAAGQHVPAWTAPQGRPPPRQAPAQIPDLPGLRQAAAWLEAERPNLYAAADYAAVTGQHLHAVQIPATIGAFLRGHGDWNQAAALHRTALAAARQAGDVPGQALAHQQLGTLAWLAGSFQDAAASLTQAITLYEEVGDQVGQAYALDHLGMVRQLTGDYAASLAVRQRALHLARASGNRLAEAVAVGHLGEIQEVTGDYPAAISNLTRALEMFRDLGHQAGEADALSELGVAQRGAGDYLAASSSLTWALALYRDLGHRPFLAIDLNELGLVQQLTGDYGAAAASHQEALYLHRDLGSRPGEAGSLNGLGELACRTSATRQAREYHAQALAIARNIGLPDAEARALEGIGRAHLRDGNRSQGTEFLRQALAIYQRIKAPAARRVHETLGGCED